MTESPVTCGTVANGGGRIPTLTMLDVTKSFSGKPALVDACFDLYPGEVHALLGENGAGKSTLMTVACGIYRADSGVIQVDGRRVAFEGPKSAHSAGIGMVHQHFRLVEVFTVLENVRLTVPGITAAALLELSSRTGLDVVPDAWVSALSVAECQRAEILKVLAGGARILLLDEPTAVLTDEEASSLLAMLRGLAADGLAIVLITHKLHQVAAYADRVTVMRAGRTVARGLATAGMDKAAVARLVVGDLAAPVRSTGRPPLTWKRLKVRGLRGTAYGPIDVDVRSGEVVGVAGVGGGGQAAIVDALAGMVASAGTVEIDGVDMTDRGPGERRAAGLRTVPADRYGRALAADLDIAMNVALTTLRSGRYGPWLRVDRRSMKADADAAITAQDVRGGSPSTRVRVLSGGNAQKLVVAREFSGDPSVIVCHSPTRGLDVGACRAVADAIVAARDGGRAILLISEDLDEVLDLSDRVLVLAGGRDAGWFERSGGRFDRASIGAAMVGHA